MAYFFEEIMDYHPDNIDVYNEIKENLSNLVPFVGSGLTHFAYPSWKEALTKLADKITNKNDSRQVKKLIRDGYYMDAAQKLEDLRTPSNLARDIAHLFSADHLTNKMDEFPKKAVSLLPWLFKGLVLTTNFDETLETVYRECGYPFQTVSHPGHPVLEQFLRNQNHCGLFKMHGTVTGNLIEYENIVFTSEQYDRNYGKDSPLIRDLKACFEKRLMFFLGCSLEKDRTMDILQDAIIRGVNHYTIIECKKSEKDEKARKLGRNFIRAILYEQGRHEAVRVILEHLLEETRPDTYQKICPVGALKSLGSSDRFSYNAGIVPLSGRKKELGELNSFLQISGIPFQWWAITGPGGCGKSRLAYEFQNQLPTGWLARYLKQSDYKNLHGMTACLTQKTLLIADYVQEHARELGEWMESLNEQPRSLPIRILLVERDAGKGSEDSAWTKQLYSNVHNENKLKETCYRKTFLYLSPLSDQDLLDIIENYTAALQGDKGKTGRVLTDKKKQMLLYKLKAIDPDLCRPLYAMFLSDAYVDSNDIEQWKREDILDYVISRERKRLQFSIMNMMHTDIMDQKLYNACVYLQCAATVLQDVSIENLQELFPDIWKTIEDRSVYFESPIDFLYQIGLVVKNELPALRPDLVGEYFVYDWLFKNREKTIHDFIIAIWRTPLSAGIFFERLLDDFSHLLNASPERWNVLLPDSIPLSENSILFYAILVSSATFYCNIVVQCEKLADLLEKLAISYPDMSDIEVAFAEGLVNLSCKQDEQGAKRTVARLEKLYSEHSDIPKIEVAFAEGLINLSNKQDEQGAERTVARLEKLYSGYPVVAETATLFANVLLNLSNKQDEQSAERTVARIEKLYSEHPNVTEIVAVFAKSLFNLSLKQDEQGTERTVVRLEKLYSEHPDVTETVVLFASVLFNLSLKQDERGAERIVAHLEKLYSEHPDVTETVAVFAKSLFNLSFKQDEQGAERTVARLEKLYSEHSDITETVVVFASALFHLSLKQDEQSVERTVVRLEKLYSEHLDVTEIAAEFAKSLFNLSFQQDEQGVERTVARLEKLYSDHPNVSETAVAFASCLANLSCAQDEQGVERTVARLEKLYSDHQDITDVIDAFARSLVNLSLKQDEQGRRRIVKHLEKLYSEHPDVMEAVVAFAKCLGYLSYVQNEQDAEKTIRRLEKLYSEHPAVKEIESAFAWSLVYLSNIQDVQGVERAVARLEKLYSDHPDVMEAVDAFAGGLVNLSCKQDEQGAKRTVARLERLYNEYPDVTQIAVAFAWSLVNLSNKQDEQGTERTVECLEKLYSEYPGVTEVAVAFAGGLANLSHRQNKQGAERTKRRLEKLYSEHPDVPEIASVFASCLVNLSH